MKQLPPLRRSPSPQPHPLPPPLEPSVEAVVQPTAQIQKAEDDESEMERDVQKKLIQQVEKYEHDMELITQVCSRSALGVSTIAVLCLLLYLPSLSLPSSLWAFPSFSVVPVLFVACSFQLSLSLFHMPFSTTEPAHIRPFYCSNAKCCNKRLSVSGAALGEAICQC